PDLGRFDLVVSSAPLGRVLGDGAALQRLARLVAGGGAIALATLAPSSFADVVFGLEPDWFGRSIAPEFPVGFLRTDRDWTDDLRDARLADIVVAPLAGPASPALLVLASARRRAALVEQPGEPQGRVVVLGGESDC